MGEKDKDGKGKSGQAPSGDAVYGLGVIGAWVYYWQRGDSAGERARGLLKGLAWPAFLVYEAFSAVAGRPGAETDSLPD
jgi:hypothetical protein